MTPKPASLPPRRPGPAERLAEAALGAPGPLRRAAGRAAARKGLHAHALACAPEDGYVLARAGFFEQAAELSKPGTAGWLGAVAGLGRIDLLTDADARLDDADRRWIAGLAAAWDAGAALEVLGEAMIAERAACLLALDRTEEAEALLRQGAVNPESTLLSAAILAGRGDHLAARLSINTAFHGQHLPSPLTQPPEGPIRLSEFSAPGQHALIDGPLVSVIVAARDAAATLPFAVASLLKQTWTSLEVLVVDDGSTDRTRAIAKGLARADERVRCLVGGKAAGASAARNLGMEQATGAFITFHDADDWAHPFRIAEQVEAAAADGRIASVAKHFRFAADGAPVSPRVFPMIRLCPISMLIRADAARAAGPLEEEPVGADSEYLARLDLLFGRPSVVRLNRLHIVAGWAGSSLSGAHATGLASAEGRALREAYERDWRVRHAERLREMVG